MLRTNTSNPVIFIIFVCNPTFVPLLVMPDLSQRMTTDTPLTLQEINRIKNIPTLFILGKERSGTSLLQNLLDSHPNIIAPPETKFIPLLYPRFFHIKKWTEAAILKFVDALYREPVFADYWRLDKQKLTQILLSVKDYADYNLLCKVIYYQMKRDKEDILLISDKNPSFMLHIPTIISIFPDTRFVHIIRDPRDNMFSLIKSLHAKNTTFHAYKWVAFNSIAEADKNIRPEKYFTVTYEKLVENTEGVMLSICNFLQVPYNEKMVQNVAPEWLNAKNEKIDKFEINTLIHKNLSSPVSTSSIGKWKKGLSKNDIAITEAITGKYATKMYGYNFEDNAKLPKPNTFKIVRNKLLYSIWEAFTRMRFKSMSVNLVYSRVKRIIFGDKLAPWEYF